MRTLAPATLVNSKDGISDKFIRMSSNSGRSQGSACSGDSGGPDLLAGTDVLLAEISFLNGSTCDSVAHGYRLDTVAARSFITAVAAQHGAPVS